MVHSEGDEKTFQDGEMVSNLTAEKNGIICMPDGKRLQHQMTLPMIQKYKPFKILQIP